MAIGKKEAFRPLDRCPCALLRLVVFVALWCAVQSAVGERLPLKFYTTADGLPHNAINKIVRDSRGFLWICTADGLSRYDGYTFTNFGTDQGLPNGDVSDLLETRSGQYFVATNGGLVRFDPRAYGTAAQNWGRRQPPVSMFTPAVVADPDPRARTINVLHQDRNGTIWCGTNKGLCQLAEVDGALVMRFVEIGIPHDFPEQSVITDLVEDADGSLWIGAFSGLYHRSLDGASTWFTLREKGFENDIIHSLLRDHFGHLWAGTRSSGFFQFAYDRSQNRVSIVRGFRLPDIIPEGWIFQLFESSDHRLWIGANTGLIEFPLDTSDGSPKVHSYTTRNGLSYREVTALSEDASGNLWLGTNTAGLMKLARNGFITYDEQDAIQSVNSIFEDGRGNLCIRGSLLNGAANQSRKRVDFGCLCGHRVTGFHLASIPLGNGGIGWVLEAAPIRSHGGEWWVGTGSGVYRFPALPGFAQLATAQPIARRAGDIGIGDRQVFRMFEDSRGDIWVSTISAQGNGFARWEHATGEWTNLTNIPGLPPIHQDLARSFAEDRAGNVWIGFNGLLARCTRGQFTWFRAQDGLPPGIIRNMHVDQAGRLWLASAEGGLVRIDQNGNAPALFRNYTAADGLSSNRTEVITEDLYGRIYVGTGRALDRLDPATGRIKHFTTADGLAPGLFRAAYRDRNGALWFGMTGGMSRLVPAPDEASSAPPIFLSSIAAGGGQRTVFPFGETELALPELSSNHNQLQVDFVGLDFTPGEVLRYQYKLTGDWSPPSEQRSISFANLEPGRYRFFVRAVGTNGSTSAMPASVTFKILPPIWKRWWFVSLVASSLAALAYLGYRYRMAQILEIANVRARIATDLHDDIGSNLTKIAILSEVARQQVSSNDKPSNDDPLSAIADISRESVASMSDIVWAINPQRDRLADLVRRMRQHAEQVFTTCGVQLNFRAPGEDRDVKLRTELRRDLFLIFKEAVNNVTRHAKCSRVEVDFRVEGECLSLDITDDGIGFDPRTVTGGQGLSNMRRRAERLGGVCEVRTGRERRTVVHVAIPTGSHVRPTSTGR